MDQPPEARIEATLRLALRTWALVTVALIIGIAAQFTLWPDPLTRFVQTGPYSTPAVTIAAVAAIWLSIGVGLVLLIGYRWKSRVHLFSVLAGFLSVALYANVGREREAFAISDAYDYLLGAANLLNHEPLHNRYLYPPLLATVLAPFLRLDEWLAFGGIMFVNFVAVGAFSALLVLTLVRYGIGTRPAFFLALGFTAINVAIVRTIAYGQINLIVMDMILLAIVLWSRHTAPSAFCMAVAVHLKFNPIALVLPFALRRDWRWLAWFGVSLFLVATPTLLGFGPGPFADFVTNLATITTVNGGLNFRETSFNSLFASMVHVGAIPESWAGSLAVLTTLLALVAAAYVAQLLVRRRTFGFVDSDDRWIPNLTPVLMIAMLLVAPLVWEHHPVFVALPFLLVLARLQKPVEWVTFGFAYVVQFAVPTFDFFPWSFGRLVSLFLLIWLLVATSDRPLSAWATEDLRRSSARRTAKPA